MEYPAVYDALAPAQLVGDEYGGPDDEGNKDNPQQAAAQEPEDEESHRDRGNDDDYGCYRHIFNITG